MDVSRLAGYSRRAEPFVSHAVAALLAAASVGLLLAILGGVIQGLGVEIESAVYWRFGIAASLVGGNLLALVMARQV